MNIININFIMKKDEDEELSILCLKVPKDNFEDISLYD